MLKACLFAPSCGKLENNVAGGAEAQADLVRRRQILQPGHEPCVVKNHVDAGKLFKDLFSHMSETRVSYLKTRHSVAITECLLEHRPEALEGLADEIEAVLDRGKTENSA